MKCGAFLISFGGMMTVLWHAPWTEVVGGKAAVAILCAEAIAALPAACHFTAVGCHGHGTVLCHLRPARLRVDLAITQWRVVGGLLTCKF